MERDVISGFLKDDRWARKDGMSSINADIYSLNFQSRRLSKC